MTDDPKRFYALGYCFLRGEDDVYRCHSLGLEMFGLYGVGEPLPFTVRRIGADGIAEWAMKMEFGKHLKPHRWPTRTGAALGAMRKLCGITKAPRGQPRRVSINDGTYVLPDGEVLSELEMIKRRGTDGRDGR